MKKTYLQPNTITVKVRLSRIITASVNSISNTQAATGDENSPANFSRRDGGLWDDEE